MTILNAIPAVAQCDGCGEQAEPDTATNPRTGTPTWAFLPPRWVTLFIDKVQVHLCPPCVAAHPDPFGDRKPDFMARIDRLGLDHLSDIITCGGIPDALGQQWAVEWSKGARRNGR